MTQPAKRRFSVRRFLKDEDGQAAVEVIILAALVGIALAWITWQLPRAITAHYVQNVRVLASPM